MPGIGSHHYPIDLAIAAAIIIVIACCRAAGGGPTKRLKLGSLRFIPAALLGVVAYTFVHSRSVGWGQFAIPVAQAPLWLFQAMALAFVALIIAAAMRRREESGARQDTRSKVGIAIQTVAFVLLGLGPVKATLPWNSAAGTAGFMSVLLLMSGVLGLFAASSSALGRNWSIGARTLSDHELVRTGPYAHVRHPIYLAMLLFLLAMATALGHWVLLIAALPIFLVGTSIRTSAEDRLLQASFGQKFVEYRNSTPGLLPWIR